MKCLRSWWDFRLKVYLILQSGCAINLQLIKMTLTAEWNARNPAGQRLKTILWFSEWRYSLTQMMSLLILLLMYEYMKRTQFHHWIHPWYNHRAFKHSYFLALKYHFTNTLDWKNLWSFGRFRKTISYYINQYHKPLSGYTTNIHSNNIMPTKRCLKMNISVLWMRENTVAESFI